MDAEKGAWALNVSTGQHPMSMRESHLVNLRFRFTVRAFHFLRHFPRHEDRQNTRTTLAKYH